LYPLIKNFRKRAKAEIFCPDFWFLGRRSSEFWQKCQCKTQKGKFCQTENNAMASYRSFPPATPYRV